MRHFTANIWHRHKNKKVIKQLKLLCTAMAEKTFDIRITNAEAASTHVRNQSLCHCGVPCLQGTKI